MTQHMRTCGSRRASIAIAAFCLSMAIDLRAAPSPQDESVYRSYLDFGSLVTGGSLTPNWLPDGSAFWYLQAGPNDRQILKLDPATGAAKPLFDVEQLRSTLQKSLGHEPVGAGVPFETFEFSDASRIGFRLEGNCYELDLNGYGLSRLPPASTFSIALVRSEAESAMPAGSFMRENFIGVGRMLSPEAMSPDRRWVAGIENNNLVMRATIDGQKVKFTTDGTPLGFWDLEAALWNPWSPDGQHLAVFKQHTEGMARIPSIEWLKSLEQAQEVIILPAGGTLHRSELYLVDMHSQRPVAIDLGDTTNQYLRILTWLPDSSELVLARYNRLLSRVDIQAVNAVTRAVRTVLTERSATFLTNHHVAIWGTGSTGTKTGTTLLPDGSGFIWNSERSGWEHLYYYDMKGKLVRQLTSGAWPVKEVVRVDQAGGWVYFTGHGDQARPYDTHLYRVGLSGKGFAQLTEGKGQHSVNLAPSAKYFTDTYSAVDVPPKTVLRKTDGTLIRMLTEADISSLKAVGWVAPKEYVVKAADGITDLWATLYFPYNFDPGKKYPLVEYIYGGPQSAVRPKSFGHSYRYGADNFNRALANLGFLVLTLDARGTPERSKAFQDVVYKNWGRFEIADHAGAVRQLADRLGFVDIDRVGIWGFSWGGHHTFRAMTQAPDIYKVGISRVPGFDPRRSTLYEPYLGLPQENKVVYDVADAFALAPKLAGDLLLIGAINDTSTQIDFFKMSEILIRLGKQHRTMIYPNMWHVPSGKAAEYDLELKKHFLVEHLMKATADR